MVAGLDDLPKAVEIVLHDHGQGHEASSMATAVDATISNLPSDSERLAGKSGSIAWRRSSGRLTRRGLGLGGGGASFRRTRKPSSTLG